MEPEGSIYDEVKGFNVSYVRIIFDDCPSNSTAILLTSKIVRIQIETANLSFILASISEEVD